MLLAIALLLAGCAPVAAGTSAPREPKVIAVAVTPGVHGVLGQLEFWQEGRSTGPSPDRLDFVFSEAADVTGVLVSVDVPPQFYLVEFAAGINVAGYGADGDWLIHTSSTEGADIDQHVMFAQPFHVEAGDRISVAAWMQNNDAERRYVSPEVIVYYGSVNRM